MQSKIRKLPHLLYLSILIIPACSNNDDTTSAKPDNSPPVFAGVESVTAFGGSNVDVSWSPASDDISVASNIRYQIYASLDPVNKGLVKDSVTGVSAHRVKYLDPANTYYITVEAVDEAGNGNDNSAQLSVDTGAEVTLSEDLQATLEAACATAGCHDAATQLHEVNLSSASASYSALVDIPIHHCGGQGALRVASGGGVAAVQASQLLNILDWESTTPCIENTGTAAIQMPPPDSSQELDHEFVHLIEHWIDAGAKNN